MLDNIFSYLQNGGVSTLCIIVGAILIVHSICRWLLLKMRLKSNDADRTIEQIDKMSGRDFEEYVAVVLEGCGFEIEEITVASGDYGADIIAIADENRFAIQCKRYGKPVGVKAVQEVISAMKHYDCEKAIVITNSTFTNQAYTLAESNEVVTLWDRDDLIKMRDTSKKRGID